MNQADYHTYPPVGHCIYCGANDVDLSKEHIIPYALNGNWVLPKASCLACQKFTQKIEEVCTFERWGMFAPMRAKHKLQSRRKWDGRRKIATEVLFPDGGTARRQFDADTFPAGVFGMRLPPAGILQGITPTNKIVAELVFRTSSPSREFLEAAPNVFTKVGSFFPTAFMQLLAKIGYAFAAAEVGSETLLPSLADAILGRNANVPHLVGGGAIFTAPDGKTAFTSSEEKTEYCHRVQIHECALAGNSFTFVSIHLFGQLGLPTYHVVVRQYPEKMSVESALSTGP